MASATPLPFAYDHREPTPGLIALHPKQCKNQKKEQKGRLSATYQYAYGTYLLSSVSLL
jgi:hypothetical protein